MSAVPSEGPSPAGGCFMMCPQELSVEGRTGPAPSCPHSSASSLSLRFPPWPLPVRARPPVLIRTWTPGEGAPRGLTARPPWPWPTLLLQKGHRNAYRLADGGRKGAEIRSPLLIARGGVCPWRWVFLIKAPVWCGCGRSSGHLVGHSPHGRLDTWAWSQIAGLSCSFATDGRCSFSQVA